MQHLPLRAAARRAPLLGVALAACLASCGGGPAVTTPAAAPRPAQAKPTTAKVAPVPPGHLARGDVDAVLASGPPWILRRVPTEEVLREGKFVGWRILALPKDWSGLDLVPGDVVLKVNGATLERPEDLWTAWTSLAVASDLRVTYERDGAARDLVFRIDGDPAKEPPPALRSDTPPPRPAGRTRGTVVIEGDDPLASDGGDD